jgi:hypothetical protein
MATAGPAKDKAADTTWTFRCNECLEVLLTGGKDEPIHNNPAIQEAIRNHTCPGKRVGRITED